MFSRTTALLGPEAMTRITQMRVFVFGVGGVGGWCAEALVRSGVGSLAIVDDDVVAPSNINRQLVATSATIGAPKVEVLAKRLLEINPGLKLESHNMRFCAETEPFFAQALCVSSSPLTSDGGAAPPQRGPGAAEAPATAATAAHGPVVIDAIDSLDEKRRLIRLCERLGVRLISSMGAALRTDPTKVTYSPFQAIAGDPLARALRNRFRHDDVGTIPSFTCVHSTEPPRKALNRGDPLGSIMPVTATFGMTLAALALDRNL